MATRLNDAIRAKITQDLLRHRFGKAQAQEKVDLKALAVDVYHSRYSPEKRAKMDDLPAGWLSEADYFYVQLGRDYVRLDLPARFRFLYQDGVNGSHAFAVFDATHEFSIRYSHINNLKTARKEQENYARHQLEVALRSVSTVERLVATWPEIEPFAVGWIEAGEIKGLPTVPVSQLNELLGLPLVSAGGQAV